MTTWIPLQLAVGGERHKATITVLIRIPYFCALVNIAGACKIVYNHIQKH